MKIENPDFNTLSNKEWLVTNGLGSYASSTAAGCNTRRYHGLLVASFNPPTDRKVLVSKLDETVIVNDKRFQLGCNQYTDVVHPDGFQFITEFERNPLPKTTWKTDNVELSKTVFMVYGRNTTVVEYENHSKNEIGLELNPLLNHRDYHGSLHENSYNDFYIENSKECIKIYAHHGALPLFIAHPGTFISDGKWYKNFFYQKEAYRGLDATEDTFSIGTIRLSLKPGQRAYIALSLRETVKNQNFEQWKKNELERLTKLRTSDDEFLNDLMVSGDQFLVKRKSTDSYTLLAGYHWFTDWGRDTMIAMRSLCIDTGKKDVSKSIIKTFLHYIDKGMLPNRFPDSINDKPEYNTIDATLWLFVVLYDYYKTFSDKKFVKEVFPKLTDIIGHHLKGTRYGIHQTDEGFLYGGEGIAQLTWMDARVGEVVVTPRHGCPVEIQALWYNALKIYEGFGELSRKPVPLLDTVKDSSKKLKKNFSKRFFNSKGYLNDVVFPVHMEDDTIRPNQIYALSLPFKLLTKKQQKSVLTTVTDELYTPYGLRTLNPGHSDFKPVYEGDNWNRDHAYHQGTVWPFLLGEYFAAYIEVHGNTKKTKNYILDQLDTLKHHFYHENCLYGVSEIFDGENPGEGRGTIQQAWSAGALIKSLSLVDSQEQA